MKEDDIVLGSKEWKSLSTNKKRGIQDKRAGVIKAKYVTEEEAKAAGTTFDDIPDPEPVEPQPVVHKVKMRDLTSEEAESLYGKARENWEGRQPQQPVKDDTMPSDRNPRDPGVIVTKVREVEGTDYRIERRNPYGFWYTVGLPELGRFTDQSAAKETLRNYLKKQGKQND